MPKKKGVNSSILPLTYFSGNKEQLNNGTLHSGEMKPFPAMLLSSGVTGWVLMVLGKLVAFIKFCCEIKVVFS